MRRLLVLHALAVLAVLAAAPSASAGDVWLWACHGPGGEPLAAPLGQRATPSGAASQTCGDVAGALRAPANSGWTFSLASGTTLREVRIFRTVDVGAGGTYRLRADQSTLETQAVASEARYEATGAQVAFEVACADACPGATVPAIGFRVSDNEPPVGSAGGVRSPAAGSLELEVSANDTGVGLRNAVVAVDGRPVAEGAFGDPACQDVSSSPGVDLPFGLVGQSDAGFPPQPVGCVGRGTLALAFDTRAFPDGIHQITVVVSDLAGNSATVLNQGIEIDNPDPVPPPAGNPVVNPPAPGPTLAGLQATSCRAPRLRIKLADKPLRKRHRVPVLRAHGRYKFSGRLTCRVGSRRRAAPKHAIIDISSRVGSRTTDEPGTTTEPRGKVSVILSFKRSQTLTFRFTSAEGQRAVVRIRLIVSKARRSR